MIKLLFICIIILITSCVILKDYTNENDSLVIGELLFIRKNTEGANGTFKSFITVFKGNVNNLGLLTLNADGRKYTSCRNFR